MANNDWDLDDLLDFHYDNGSPDKNKDFEILDELQKKDEPSIFHTPKEVEALRQASHDAYERYRSNYVKGKKKREGNVRVSKFDKALTMIYVIAFAVFTLSMLIMNVLPFGMGVLLFGVLILLSLVILVQTRKRSIKKWGKRLATLLAVVMIVFYGMGTAYALGTLSFLSGSSLSPCCSPAGRDRCRDW